MITREEFLRLKQGDVLLVRTPKGRMYTRTILQGPADEADPHHGDAVYLPKLCRSWTRRAYTVYFWNELKDRAEVTGLKSKHLINTFEHERLLRQGLNPRREMVREIQERADTAKRLNRPMCRFQIKPISKVS